MSAAPVLVKAKNFSLSVIAGPALTGEKFYFAKPVVHIGREKTNDLVLDKDGKVSRVHIEISQNNGVITIKNVSEKNMLLVQGRKMDSIVIDGKTTTQALLQIGDTQIKFEMDKVVVASARPSTPVPVQPPRPQSPVASSPVQPAQSRSGYPPAAMGSMPKPAKPAPTLAQRPMQKPSAPVSTGFSMDSLAQTWSGWMSNPKSKYMVYAGIFAVLILIGSLMNSGSTSPAKKQLQIRSTEEIAVEVEKTGKAIEEVESKKEKSGENSIQYQTAQQHYIKGFRDYRQGQYDRAIQSFQAALSFYPQHELAKKYLIIARKKFDEFVKFQMAQGRRYQGKNNWRLCIASYRQAMAMIKDERDPNYRESKQFMEQCEVMQRGKY